MSSTFHKPIYEHRQNPLARIISPHLKPGARVPDLGCRFGQSGRALVDALQKCRPDEKARRIACRQSISLLDWAANAGHEVPILYRYHNLRKWRGLIGKVSTRRGRAHVD